MVGRLIRQVSAIYAVLLVFVIIEAVHTCMPTSSVVTALKLVWLLIMALCAIGGVGILNDLGREAAGEQ